MRKDVRYRVVWALGVALMLMAVSLACAAAEPTPTPVPPAPPAPPAAPTAAPAPAATLAPGAPTPVPAAPTPTRALPTPTPLVTGRLQYGGTVRFAGPNFSSLDPNFSRFFIDRDAMFAIYNGLVTVTPELTFQPGLAESWDISADGKTVTFRLRQGIKFHDSTDFNADAIKKNFEYTMNRDLGSVLRPVLDAYLSRVDVVNSNTVTLQLKVPYRPLFSDMGTRDGISLAIGANAVEKLGGGLTGRFGRQPVGTGPFKFVEWIPGNRLIVERNENYWEKGKPYLDRVIWLEVPDYSVQLAMVRTGEAEMMVEVRNDDLPILRRNPDVKIDTHNSGRFYGIFMSTDRAPWNNQKLRAAIAYAIDRKTLSDTIYGGGARPAYIPEGSGWAFNPNVKTYEYNLQKAKETLTAAGYPSGITFNYWCGSTATLVLECETIQAMLAKASINTNIVLVPAGELFTQHIQGRANFLDTFYSPRPDPHGRIFRVFNSAGAGNPSKHKIPGLDELIDQAATVYDIAKAKPLYDQIQQIIAEDARVVFKVYTNEYSALSSRVQGYVRYADLNQRFGEIWLQK